MFRPYIFIGLYIVTGILSWQTISAISSQDTSTQAIKQMASSAVPASVYQSIEKWKAPSIIPPTASELQLQAYEKELAQLRKLPQAALPANVDITKKEDRSLLDQLELSEWSELSGKIKSEIGGSDFIQDFQKPLHNANRLNQNSLERLDGLGETNN